MGFKVFETVIDPADINRARATFGEKMQVIGPKQRQGFMVLDVASEDEAFTLLAELSDFCEMDAYPLASFETLGKYLAGNPL